MLARTAVLIRLARQMPPTKAELKAASDPLELPVNCV